MTGDALARALRQACTDLSAVAKPFALVGGLAVSLRGYVRFTRDIDFAVVAHDDREVEAIVRTMRTRGDEVVTLIEPDETKRIATVRLSSPLGVTLDLLTASSGIEADLLRPADAEVVDLECWLERPRRKSRESSAARDPLPSARAPGFVQAVSHILGLKSERSPGRIAGQGEFLAVALVEKSRDRMSLISIRGGGDAHGDDGLPGDHVTRRSEHVGE